jgi:uncharacterized protein (TIGR00730 family)
MQQGNDMSKSQDNDGKRVSVFGGSTPQPGDSAYQQAYDLGQILAQAGYTVITGGYIGTMEAVSRGAAESGGHVIGATCDEIEHWRPVKANKWVIEEVHFHSMRERLHYLIETCAGALALPGGIGTLAEIAVMWSHLQTGVLTNRALILIGDKWRETFQQFIDDFAPYVKSEHRGLLMYAPDADGAFSLLEQSFK